MLADLCARRWGYRLWDAELWEDLRNPFRRGLMLALLEEIDAGTVPWLLERITELAVTCVNALGAVIQAAAGAKNPKDILKWKKKREHERVVTLPGGRKVVVK